MTAHQEKTLTYLGIAAFFAYLLWSLARTRGGSVSVGPVTSELTGVAA